MLRQRSVKHSVKAISHMHTARSAVKNTHRHLGMLSHLIYKMDPKKTWTGLSNTSPST